jgi:GAF domain-containing protein
MVVWLLLVLQVILVAAIFVKLVDVLFISPLGTALDLADWLVVALAVLWFVAFFVNRRMEGDWGGLTLAVLMLGGVWLLLANAGPLSPSTTLLVLPVIAAGLFGPPVSAVVIAGVTAVAYLAFNLALDPVYISKLFGGGFITQTLFVYVNVLVLGVATWLFSRSSRHVAEERHELSLALVEQREETMARLTNQTRQFQAAVSVARALMGQRDLDHLLEETVRVIQDAFGYSHVQVFLVDEENGYAVLRQRTGQPADEEAGEGIRHLVGSTSLIGQVTRNGQALIGRESDRHQMMAGMRTEVVLPLAAGDRLFGALDLQSVAADAFREDNLPLLQLVADQVAVAIENARLYDEAEEHLRQIRQLGLEESQRSWAEFLHGMREEHRYQSYGPDHEDIRLQRSQLVERVLSSGSSIISSGADGQPAFIAVPIVVRNDIVGVLGVEPDGVREWTQDDLLLMEGIAQRTSLAVETARLYVQSQRAAQRERIITEISDRLQRAPNLSILLESAARELAAALGTDNVYAEISVGRPLARRRRSVAVVEQEPDHLSGMVPLDNQAAPDEAEEARAEL